MVVLTDLLANSPAALGCHSLLLGKTLPEGVREIWGVPKMVGFSPKSSILIGFSIINHPFWGTLIFGNTHMMARLIRIQFMT